MASFGLTELLILLSIPVAAVAGLAILFFVIRAATRSGNQGD